VLLVVEHLVPPIRRVLLLPGSLRAQSTNSAILRTARAVAPDAGIEPDLYEGLGVLPHFNPDGDRDPRPPAIDDLRQRIRVADALMFSVPEYAGALPGSLKNLLDWTIGDERAGSIYEKPVAWINASPRGAVNAHEQLRHVLNYAHATIIEDACVHIPAMSDLVGPEGLITDTSVWVRIAEALTVLASACRGPW
jgi:chromate reductase